VFINYWTEKCTVKHWNSKRDYITHFIASAISYMSWHQGAIIREFISINVLLVQNVFQALRALTSIIKVLNVKTPDYIPTVYVHIAAVTREAHGCVVVILQQCVRILVGVCNLSFRVLKLLTFMMELRANSVCNTCWTYKTMLLINSLITAPWCRNM